MKDSSDSNTNQNKQRVQGGQNVYGASVGILMLDTAFPRIPGDIGNAQTWQFPVHYKIVRGASVKKVIGKDAEELVAAFVEAAEELISMGAQGITTSCGFMSLFQKERAAAINVPVASSSLIQVPMVQHLLPPSQKVGILTVSQQSLTPAHLSAVGASLETPIMGTDEGVEFSRVFVNNETSMDLTLIKQDIIDAGKALKAKCPELGAVVMECTNMAPYANLLQRELGVPVYSIYSLIRWFQSGLVPTVFPSPH